MHQLQQGLIALLTFCLLILEYCCAGKATQATKHERALAIPNRASPYRTGPIARGWGNCYLVIVIPDVKTVIAKRVPLVERAYCPGQVLRYSNAWSATLVSSSSASTTAINW